MAATTNRSYVGFNNGDASADETNFAALQAIDIDMQAALTGDSAPVGINMAGSGNVAMTPAQGEASIIFLGGARTTNGNLNLPQRAKAYMIYNGTTGNFTVLANTVGTGANSMLLPQGASTWLYCDGTNVYFLSSSRINAMTAPNTNYTARWGDRYIFSDDSGGNRAHLLPTPIAQAVGLDFILKKFGNATYTTTFTAAGATFDGATSIVLTAQNQVVKVVCDGSNTYRVIT